MGLHRDATISRLARKNEFLDLPKVEQVLGILDEKRQTGHDPGKFEDLAVELGLMTSQQASALALAYQRLRKDAEKKRWSIPGYEIFGRLGEGGLGVVFRARQVSMNRLVALKILHKRWLNDEEFKQRFLVEARLVGKLSHQNLIKVFDVGREDWKYYFSMEYIEGPTLEEILLRDGAIPIQTAIDYILQVLRAIKYIARFNIVHCDIKPSNILVTKEGICKLGDFGFVKSNLEIKPTEEGAVLGTPDYISPEQAMGEKDIDFRSDLYSLGATFYQLVTARPPFDGTVSTIMEKHIKATPPSPRIYNPKIPLKVCRVIEKMMAKRPEDRYQSCDSLFEELELVKIRAETGRDYDVGRVELVEAIEKEKERQHQSQMEKLQVTSKLQRMTTLFWVMGGLLGISLATIIYLIIQLSRRVE